MNNIQELFQTFHFYLSVLKKHQNSVFPIVVGTLFFIGSSSLVYGTVLVSRGPAKAFARTPVSEKFTTTLPSDFQNNDDEVLIVDIAGAVEKPGIYNLQKGDRVSTLIEKSGGFHKKANKNAIARDLNLAQRVQDEQKLYIPFIGEDVSEVKKKVAVVTTQKNDSSTININSASESELENLEGIGKVKASQIISGRPFKSIEELVEKKIVSESLFEKIKSKISN